MSLLTPRRRTSRQLVRPLPLPDLPSVSRHRYFATFILILLYLIPTRMYTQEHDTIRVCTYNLDGFSGSDFDLTANLRTVFEHIRPSILVVQGLELTEDLTSYPLFRESVASALSTPLTGFSFFVPDDEFMVAILYDREKLAFVPDPGTLPTEPVVHAWMRFRVEATGDTLVVMTGEWMKGDEEEDHAVRREAALAVSATLKLLAGGPGGSANVIFAGTLNLRSSDEDAYGILAGEDSSAVRLFDPANRPGAWSDSPEYSSLHTSSTRVTVTGEDTTGGLRDRFDQILLGLPLLSHVIPGSYAVFGHDGELFGRSVNDEANESVPPAYAQSLWTIGVHLPVVIDLVFGGTLSIDEGDRRPEALDLSVDRSTSIQPPCR